MEQVLVVKRKELEALLGEGEFITQEIHEVIDFILKHHFFVPREEAEYDNSLKQIIPYVVIRQNHRYFTMRRLKKQTEVRLHDQISLGVGGHINPGEEGKAGCSVLEAGMQRELREEVFVERTQSVSCVGILNENNGGVSDYHMGLVYLLEAQGDTYVRETEKMEGDWLTLAELKEIGARLETWSKIVVEQLLSTLS